MTDAAARPPALDIERLTVHPRAAPQAALLHEVSLRVPAGGTVAVVGASGSGKTLIVRSILQLLPPGLVVAATSRIRVHGAEPVSGSDRAVATWRATTVGVVPAGVLAALDPVRTLRQQAARIAALTPTATADADLPALLRTVGLTPPEHFADRYPHQLSGGEAQRAALALALLRRPSLLLVDEPTTALDALGRDEIVRTLRDVRTATDAALVVVTHDLDVATALADALVVVSDGRVVAAGAPGTVWAGSTAPAVRTLVAAWPRWPTPTHATPTAAHGPSVLRAEQLSVRLGSTAALHDVSVDIGAGERVAVVGRSGSGKSTLVRALLGLQRVDHGRVLLHGAPLPGARDRHWRRHVQWVMQDAGRSLDPRRRVAQAVTEGRDAHGLASDPARVDALLAEVGLAAALRSRFPHELSTGQRQRVALARALALEPTVLLLDEPLTGLDPVTAARFATLLTALHAARPLTLITILHDLALAPAVADRTLVLHDGQLVEDADTMTLLHRPSHPVSIALCEAARRAALSVPSGA